MKYYQDENECYFQYLLKLDAFGNIFKKLYNYSMVTAICRKNER